MDKSKKQNEDASAFDRFQKLAKGLLTVPRQELQKKLDQEKLHKQKRKKVA